MLADYHVHTRFSDDSECPMEAMVRQAIRLGLDEIAFTEHVDYGVKTDLNCNYPAYLKEIARQKEIYGSDITIRTGVEFGVQIHTIPQYERDAKVYPWDFVILSNHQVDDLEYWNNRFQPGKTQEEIHRGYYTATYEVMRQYKQYSVLGHLDMIKRYDPFGEYPDEKNMELIDAILSRVIADGKGIEVNPSCFRYQLNDLTPSTAILKRYLELGGEILTIGSDAHDAAHLADHFAAAAQRLKDIGFREFCTFEKMPPVFHRL